MQDRKQNKREKTRYKCDITQHVSNKSVIHPNRGAVLRGFMTYKLCVQCIPDDSFNAYTLLLFHTIIHIGQHWETLANGNDVKVKLVISSVHYLTTSLIVGDFKGEYEQLRENENVTGMRLLSSGTISSSLQELSAGRNVREKRKIKHQIKAGSDVTDLYCRVWKT